LQDMPFTVRVGIIVSFLGKKVDDEGAAAPPALHIIRA